MQEELGRTEVPQGCQPESVPELTGPPRPVWCSWAGLRLLAIALDDDFEDMAHAIRKRFVPRSEHAQEFFGPAVSGLVGCAVFAVFDRFGVGNMKDGGSSKVLIHEAEKSLESPYFMLALFLAAIALVMESSDGKNMVSRWVVAPFLRLAEHVTMLAVGVISAVAISDAYKGLVGAGDAAMAIWVLIVMTMFAWAFGLGVRYCRGRFASTFHGRLGRKSAAVLFGVILAVIGVRDIVRFAKAQEAALQKQRAADVAGCGSHDGDAKQSPPGSGCASCPH